jgi:hypothetical protein
MYQYVNEPFNGCTVGVVHTNDGLLFFKNRDLQSKYQLNRLIAFRSTPDIYALEGVNLKTHETAGL